MGGFKATLINEIEKLYKKKKIIVAAVLALIFIIVGQLATIALRNGFGVRTVGSMEFPILVLSVVANTIIPLFAALITIDSFSGEFSQNTMKISLTRPVTRFKFFTAKLTAIIIFVFLNLMFVMVFSVLAGLIFNSNTLTAYGIIRIFISYIVTIFPMIILVMMIIFFSNLINSGIGVFFLSIIVFLGFKVLGILFSDYSGIFFTSMLDWYNLWIMSVFPFIKILREFLLLCSYGIILFTGGFYLFDKKNF
jgi:ABC-2 type transport system permease protein